MSKADIYPEVIHVQIQEWKSFFQYKEGYSAGIGCGSAPVLEACRHIILTSYYPAPYGGYDRLFTTGNAYLAHQGGKVYWGPGDASTCQEIRVEA